MLGLDTGRCFILGRTNFGRDSDVCDSVEVVFDREDFAASLIEIVLMGFDG